jgi:acetyl esterase/lipase
VVCPRSPVVQGCATALRPVLVYFHGGGYFSGAKSREARLLLEGLASRGWVCVSANYRLIPAQFPAQVEDAKRVIAPGGRARRDH